MIQVIDLNCDLGEGAGRDELLMPIITSANIACGAHAGDEETMRATVRLALAHKVAIGAHPGFEDRANFGRREYALDANEIFSLVCTQMDALRSVAEQEGAPISYLKPHGALYNMAARDAAVADAIAEAVSRIDPSLRLYGLAGGKLIEAGASKGLQVVSEVFADRTYQPDGSLTSRGRPDALIKDVSVAVEQVLSMAREGRVRAIDGAWVELKIDTLCLHGDRSDAVTFAQAVRNALTEAGVRIQAPR